MRSGGAKRSERILFFQVRAFGGQRAVVVQQCPQWSLPPRSHSCVVTSILNRAELATKGYCSTVCDPWGHRRHYGFYLARSPITHSENSCRIWRLSGELYRDIVTWRGPEAFCRQPWCKQTLQPREAFRWCSSINLDCNFWDPPAPEPPTEMLLPDSWSTETLWDVRCVLFALRHYV